MKINTIKVAVLMALGLIGGVKGVNAQGFLYSTVESAPWGLILRANSDNSNHEEPILFQVGQNSNSLRDFRLKIDKEKSIFNTDLTVYGDLSLPGRTLRTRNIEAYADIEFTGPYGAIGQLKSKGVLKLRSGARKIGAEFVDVDNDKIVFYNGADTEIAKLKDGAFTLNELSTIETPGSLKLQPGISNKEDAMIAFLSSENSEMARLQEGILTLNESSTIKTPGGLNLKPGASSEDDVIIFFNSENSEMARLQDGKLTLDQISLNVTTFPDYVFAKEYRLMPLNEVASYIKENKHLPNMPTEKEVVKEGMNVGQINTLLVEKVEELTLYTIEQEEKIQAQEKTMKALLQKLEALETLVKSKK
ncbi:hypothetical protein [Tenacibaculum maritimum]|uniref:hypothetical protein n=1 Tax=Tenacibaculum maritimum TaxID=107401 RepID=UPI00388E6C21